MSSAFAIDHIGIQVSDFAASLAFYRKALKPLGWKKVMQYRWEGGQGAGLGVDGKPFFWISTGKKVAPHVHIALGAPSRAAVDAFYKAAIKAGGKDNGAPGVRQHYHPNYYAAFVLDPDGHNIEAVTHLPEKAAKKPAAKAAAAKKPARAAKAAGAKTAKAAPKRGAAKAKAVRKAAAKKPTARKTRK